MGVRKVVIIYVHLHVIAEVITYGRRRRPAIVASVPF